MARTLRAPACFYWMMKKLRFLLGDQLNIQHSWFSSVEPDTVYVLMELRQESTYVTHHIQKIVAFFSAMEAFAENLRQLGHEVIYVYCDAPENSGNLETELSNIIETRNIELFEYQLPDEYRLDKQLRDFCLGIKIPSKAYDTEHFFCRREELAQFFEGKKQYLMEFFYRMLRKRTGYLMRGTEPEGGIWNFDHENRKPIKERPKIPQPPCSNRDVNPVLNRILKAQLPHFGTMPDGNFPWPLTAAEAKHYLEHFVQHLLPDFGSYQDAMQQGEPFLFHSRLSFAMNVKLLHPAEVVERIIAAHRQNPHRIALNQTEGFVRQVLGWREYMRGIYWAHMPEYAHLNFFGAQQKLPTWFWDGNTKMNCLKQSINQSLDFAYAHHIQRLMITGNFMLLAGIDPNEADRWYLGIYIDAIEWVEITNTRGMSQFADGGIVGSKPYCSSAAYINKMSNYCQNCYYNSKLKTEHNACPFNSLYWHFHLRNRDKLERNPRIGMMYKTWDKMTPHHQDALLQKAELVLDKLDDL
jgi:deoxyribodipyrimidine photolyase-related protein